MYKHIETMYAMLQNLYLFKTVHVYIWLVTVFADCTCLLFTYVNMVTKTVHDCCFGSFAWNYRQNSFRFALSLNVTN